MFISLCNNLYGQESNAISDSIVEKFIAWEIDNSEKNSEDQKIWKKRINQRVIPWEEALIDMIESAQFPNNFENQFKQIIELDNSSNNGQLKTISELFSNEDVIFLKLQYENARKKTEWSCKSRKGQIKKNPKNNFYSYSIPLFDKTKTIAILYKEFYCGSVCSYGYLNIYRKENGIWKLYKSTNCWMS